MRNICEKKPRHLSRFTICAPYAHHIRIIWWPVQHAINGVQYMHICYQPVTQHITACNITRTCYVDMMRIWTAPYQSSSDMITWNKRWEERHRGKLRADNIDNGRGAYSPRCSTQMFKLHGTSSSFETTCANALTKSILNKWRLIWQTWRSSRHFAGWTALTARVFSRVKNLKRLQHLRHSTLPSSTVLKGVHAISSLLWISTKHNERLCVTVEGLRTHPTKPRHRSLFC